MLGVAATSLYTERDHQPATRHHFHIESVCTIGTEFDVLSGFSSFCQPEIIGEDMHRKVAHQPARNVAGSAVTEDRGVVMLLRVLDGFGDRDKVWAIVGAALTRA